ncbi:MAG TPA: hypothetical protein VGU67_03025 [Edaphobacter sp.]|nr:hypothetical protein [Edaphobacter sp.]
MSLAINRYEPTLEEIEAEARVFEREGTCDRGPLHALLVERIRFKMLETAFTEKTEKETK